MKRLNLVVTCTKTKSLFPEDGFSIRDNRYRGLTLDDGWRAWKGSFDSKKSNCKTEVAKKLYKGPHWSSVSKLFAGSPNGGHLSIWVCSAGLGLISSNSYIPSYGATFSKGHPDSIWNFESECKAGDVGRDWWNLLTSWKPYFASGPRSLAELARDEPDVPVIVVGSAEYVKAMEDDLVSAKHELIDSKLLSIISCGTKSLLELNENLLPVESRLRTHDRLRGPLLTLNMRVVVELIEASNSTYTAPELQRHVRQLLNESEAQLPSYSERISQTDNEIRAYILSAFNTHKGAQRISRSKLLRQFRSKDNFKCSEDRFKRLYEDATADVERGNDG